MLAAWNEKDPARARSHLDKALAPDVHFVDPSVDIVGIGAFEANVHELHKRVPGAVYPRARDVDEHHGYYRYDWAIHLDGDLVLAGFAVTAIDATGRVKEAIGRFGPLEPSRLARAS